MHSEKAVFKIGGLNLLPSDYCPRGKFYILGGPVKKPENWASMTDNEKIRWAAKYSAKVIYNPLDKIPEIPAPIEP